MSPYALIWILPLAWCGLVAAILACFQEDIRRMWREPVLAHPILVIESDDWGAGPLVQAEALAEMAGVLRGACDSAGRKPVMSLAVVLAVPDGDAVRRDGRYHRLALDQAPFAPILRALKQGEAEGVFSIQLHGMEHFWPGAVMASADPAVADWLRGSGPASTEALPAHLQSRWTDATQLPSRPLPEAEIRRAVAEEVAAHTRIMGRPPTIVVPPTFIWTATVERAWADNGIECLITPGQQYTYRDAQGANEGDDRKFANGDRRAGITYLVRCDYFEPAKGRDADYALRALVRASAEGRPCVLENHRVNFCRDVATRAGSLAELQKLVAGALSSTPGLRFMSSDELFHTLVGRDPQWIVASPWQRAPFLWRRLRASGRLWKLLKFSGAGPLGNWILSFEARKKLAYSHV